MHIVNIPLYFCTVVFSHPPPGLWRAVPQSLSLHKRLSGNLQSIVHSYASSQTYIHSRWKITIFPVTKDNAQVHSHTLVVIPRLVNPFVYDSSLNIVFHIHACTQTYTIFMDTGYNICMPFTVIFTIIFSRIIICLDLDSQISQFSPRVKIKG